MSLITSLIPSLAEKPVQAQPRTEDRGPTVSPRYEISETAEAFALVVQLPGVAKDGLELSVDHEEIRLVGRRAWRKPEDWTVLHRETVDASFELVLAHDRAIDVEKVSAELRDGVLRVALAKAASLKPRKITVG
jgi:HSP20 family protein